jgi:hypothetical protein
MSQDLNFYKQKILTEEASKLFKTEEILETVKTLLKNKKLEEETNLIESLFEDIELESSFQISAYDKNIEELIREKFIPQSRILMVDEEIWKYIEEEGNNQSKKLKNDKNSESINRDIKKLNKLFKENQLFILVC